MRDRRFSSVIAALLAGVVFSAAGCSSDESSAAASAAPKSNSKKDLTAPKAWKKLQDEANAGGFFGGLGDIALKNNSNSKLSDMFTQEQKKADAKVEQAMNSDLPSEALRAMVNEVAEYFVVKLAKIDEVNTSKNQYVLAFGDFDTGGNRQMSAAMDELVGRLFENQEIKKNYYVVTTTETDASKLVAKVSGNDLSAFRDPLQREKVDPTLPAKFDPAYIYLIRGKLDSAKDKPDHTVTVTMSMELVKPIERKTIDKPAFVRTYMWHPYRNAWELQP